MRGGVAAQEARWRKTQASEHAAKADAHAAQPGELHEKAAAAHRTASESYGRGQYDHAQVQTANDATEAAFGRADRPPVSDEGPRTVPFKAAMAVLTALLALAGGVASLAVGKAAEAAEARAENAVLSRQTVACENVITRSEKLLAALESSGD